jgi:hypothetical protein
MRRDSALLAWQAAMEKQPENQNPDQNPTREKGPVKEPAAPRPAPYILGGTEGTDADQPEEDSAA